MQTSNMAKTALLLGALTGFFLLIGGFLGGTGGMIIALIFAAVLNLGAWYYSGSLAIRFSGAQEVSEEQAPELHRLVAQLAQNANMPKPKVYVIPSDAPNAFATGRNPANGAVAVTQGILRLLSPDELAGVIAHELAHIKNYDTLISSIAATVAGAISMLAEMVFWSSLFGGGDEEGSPGIAGGFLMMIMAPIAAMFIQMAISRSREFIADESGARILGDPLPLARALGKIEAYAHQAIAAPQPAQSAVNPGTAHLYIINPLAGGSSLGALFRTHPPTEERIARLEAMARQGRAGAVV